MSIEPTAVHDAVAAPRRRRFYVGALAKLVGNMESADLLLVAADGRKLPAHECILRARAPGFYQRHVEATVAIGDIDSSGLEFFIHSVYTEDEMAQFPSQLDEERQLSSFSPSSDVYIDSTTTDVIVGFDGTTTDSVYNDNIFNLYDIIGSGDDIVQRFGDRFADDEFRVFSRREKRVSMSKFIRLDREEPKDIQKEYLERKRSREGPKQIFPMFIGLADGDTDRAPSDVPRSGRIIMTKRLSMTSLTSLNSIDMTPTSEAQIPPSDRAPCSRLASDLMQMYLNNQDTDVVIRTESGDLHAHKYSRNAIHFLLSFLYGGLTSIPEEVDVWEVIALATHLNHKDLADVVILHLKATRCHWFHRPCASCVSAVFDALPQFASIRCLKPLYDEALAWQARHFARIWKGRVFGHLNERWQRECYEAIIQHLDDETLIDTILGCERLQIALPRSKSESALAVLLLVDDVLEVAMQFLVHSFHLVVTSRSFQQQGKGLALNLGVLEGLLPSVVHSLSADVAIKTFKGLDDLLEEIRLTPASPSRSLSIPLDDYSPFLKSFWNSILFSTYGDEIVVELELECPVFHAKLKSSIGSIKRVIRNSGQSTCFQRFCSLVRRIYELIDKHMLHYAASVVKADAYHLLSERQQARIQEGITCKITGLFVELRQPKAPPPRFSSHNRSYKRSASAGVQFSDEVIHERSRSIDRGRPLSTIQQTVSTTEEVEKSGSVAAETSAKEQPVERKRERKDETITQPESVADSKGAEKDSSSSVSRIKQPSVSRQTSKERKSVSRSTSQEKSISTAASESQPSSSAEQLKESTSSASVRSDSPRNKSTRPSDARKSPSKKKAIETEEGRLERQTTHTIMNVERGRVVELPGPGPSPTKTTEKPKSVVKPMVKDPPLASSAQRTVTRTAPTRTTKDPKIAGAVKSSIPKSLNTAPVTKVAAARAPTRSPAADLKTAAKPSITTRTARSPKPSRPAKNSIEK
ncbi:unnamed protein product [Nippostrongylus brasiliensis]|uniref:BTB domain-containing protein n=1 Tax=Nippostrongylus brasiliensis TaxID=27835 RepID=A0A158QY54_NIPBR|nr:unnamed protein product [Nippostrongylus brasiliensis]